MFDYWLLLIYVCSNIQILIYDFLFAIQLWIRFQSFSHSNHEPAPQTQSQPSKQTHDSIDILKWLSTEY